jgi:hypothetical protein
VHRWPTPRVRVKRTVPAGQASSNVDDFTMWTILQSCFTVLTSTVAILLTYTGAGEP